MSTADLKRIVADYAKKVWPETIRPDGSVDIDKAMTRAKIMVSAEIVRRNESPAIEGAYATIDTDALKILKAGEA